MKKCLFAILLFTNAFLFGQSVTVTSPNGGERYQKGQTYNITWTSSGVTNVQIEYSEDNGANWADVVASTAAATGTFPFDFSTVTPSAQFLIRITDTSAPLVTDESDNVFTVTSLVLTSPNGSEHLLAGSAHNITWTSSQITNVKLEYTTDNGTSWSTIVASLSAALGTYAWTVPNLPSTGCKVRVSDVTNALIEDVSDAVFTIANLTLTAPNGGENFLEGSVHTITWTSQNVTNVNLEYSVDGGINYNPIAGPLSAASGSYNWTVPAGLSTNCLISITDANFAGITDECNGTFTVSNLSITSPAGAEVWMGGSSQNITWTSNNIANVKIDYSTDNGSTWTAVANSVVAALGTYNWSLPNTPSTQCKIRISDLAYSSNLVVSNVFTIEPIPTIVVTSPNGNENWQDGSAHNITWTATYNIANVDISYSINNGSSWISVAATVNASLGTYSWTIPNNPSQNCLVKVANSLDGSVNDVSNNTFVISSLNITAPNGAEQWQDGKSYNITWTSTNVSNVMLEYTTDGGTSWTTIAASVVAAGGTYAWTVPNASSANCKVRISDASNSSINDASANTFTISSITLTSPNGGENWVEGSVHAVTWSSANVTNVMLEYSDDSGSTWNTITASTAAAAGTYNWTVPANSASTYSFRISDAGNAAINDLSDNLFTVSKISLTSPIGTENWKVGTSHDITWNSSVTVSNVKLEYTTNNGSSWTTIAASIVASLGTYRWIVPNTTSINCKLRVSNVSSPSVNDVSTAFFTISKSLIVTSPNGGEAWEVGSIRNITWTRDPAISFIRIQYTKDNGLNWTDINNYVDASLGTYAWTIPNFPSSNCLIRINDVDNVANIDSSDAKFTIQTTPIITVTRPNGGDSFETGAQENITWTSNNITTVKIEYSINNGSTWNLIKSALPSTGLYTWNVPNVNSSQCKIKITSESNSNVYDISDDKFTIVPRIVVTAPNGGESLPVASSYAVTWTSTNVTNMKIEYSTDNGSNWNEVVASTPAAAGTYNWTVPNTVSSQCLIKLSDASKPEVYDIGDNVFTISNKIKLLSPNGSESWQAGSSQTIQWQSSGVANVNIYYSSNNGLSWNAVASTIAASLGSYSWTVPSTAGNQFKIKVSETANVNVFDISDGSFTVTSLNLTAPNGSENFAIGSTQNITWTSSFISNVKLEFSTDNGLNWYIITGSTPSNGVYYWQVPNAASTQCKVRISETGNPSTYDISSNTFSITESPTVKVLYPNGGESLGIGTPEIIKWTSSNVNNVKLEYSVNGGTSWTTITSSVQSTGSYTWTVPSAPSSNCKIRISDASRPGISDVSDSVFTIDTAPKIAILFPNGSENILVGSIYYIKWNSSSVSNVKIEYSTNNGVDWSTAEQSYPSSGSYAWTVPNTPSNLCKVKVSDASNQAVFDESDNVFIISSSPYLTVTSPNGGEKLEIGKTHEIKWTSTNVDNVKLEYSMNNGNTWLIIVSSVKSTGSYTWSVPNTPSVQCKIKISDVSKPSTYDLSDSVFAISYSPKVAITSPNGGEALKVGTYSNITWTSMNVASVKLEYSVNNGVSWSTIVESTPSTGSYSWQVANAPSTQCRIKISDVANPEVIDLSDNTFSITESPAVTVISPNGGENFSIGKSETIKWTSTNVNNVKIEYSINGGTNWTLITSSFQSIGSFAWTVPNAPSNICKIRITDTSRPEVSDVSDTLFTITSAPKITVLNPNGGDTLKNNSNYEIKWSSSNVSNVRIEYSLNNGVDWIVVEDSYPSTGSYGWIVPNVSSSLCKVRITDIADQAISDESNNTFMIISAPYIKVNSPNGGEKWEIGKSYNISWTSNNVDKVKLEYSVNNGNTWSSIVNSTSSTGAYLWTVPANPSVQAKVRITDVTKSTNSDVSDSLFSIVYSPKISILGPGNGEVLKVGSYYNLTWTSNNVANVKLEYSINNGVSWLTITDSAPSTGLYVWQVPNTPSYQCKVRISDASDPQVLDVSANPFTIAYISLLTPTDGETVLTGSPYTITWKTEGIINIKIEYSTNEGTNWTTIATSVDANKGSYKWNVPLAVIQSCKIKITDISKPTVFDSNENGFTVKQIIVVSPAENARWAIGSTQLIQWQSYSVSKVNIEYSVDNGLNWDTLAVDVPSSVGIYYWIIPNTPSQNCLVRVVDAANLENYGVNQKYFSIGTFTDAEEDRIKIPDGYELGQNYPNPFNPTTSIIYKIPRDNFVVLKVFDLLGKEVYTLVNERKRAGTYKVVFDGSEIPSGVYIYTIRTADYQAAKKFMLVK